MSGQEEPIKEVKKRIIKVRRKKKKVRENNSNRNTKSDNNELGNSKIKNKDNKTKTKTEKKRKQKEDIEQYKKEFLQEMDDKTKVAYEIAKEHLDTSFDIEKCLAFQKFMNERMKK